MGKAGFRFTKVPTFDFLFGENHHSFCEGFVNPVHFHGPILEKQFPGTFPECNSGFHRDNIYSSRNNDFRNVKGRDPNFRTGHLTFHTNLLKNCLLESRSFFLMLNISPILQEIANKKSCCSSHIKNTT